MKVLEKVYTVNEVARICDVTARRVRSWFDNGELEGYRTPSRRDRRIFQGSLIKFLERYNMPLGDLKDQALSMVLIVSQDQILTEDIISKLSTEHSFNVEATTSAFSAGIQTKGLKPDCIVLDFSIGRAEALSICHYICRSGEFSDVILIALLPTGNSMSLDPSVVGATFKKPLDTVLFAKKLLALIGAKKELV